VLGEKHYRVWVVDGWMSMEQWWNDTDRGNWSAGRKTCRSQQMVHGMTRIRTRTTQVMKSEIHLNDAHNIIL